MLLFTLLFVFLGTLVFVHLLRSLWSRRDLYKISSQLNGPTPALPLIGNALLFAGDIELIFEKLRKCMNSFQHPMRVWLGSNLLLIFSDTDHIEKILSSTKIMYKSDLYDIMKNYVGRGLITNSGPQWRQDRKVLQPLFNLNFVKSAVDVMQDNCSALAVAFNEFVDKGYCEIHDIVHCNSFDIIGEIITGIKLNTLQGENQEVIRAMEDIYDNIFRQMVKPWLHSTFIFNLTSYQTERRKMMNIIKSFILDVIEKSKVRVESQPEVFDNPETLIPIVDQITKIGPKFDLDLYVDHLITLFAASEDTTTITVCTTCMCLGMYPEYQEIAAQEIRDVFGETPRKVTFDDLAKLKYLEMCIKDCLRLATIAPFILRKCTEAIQVGKLTIPVNSDVLIPIFEIHRDPKHWQNPEHFYPDHFLPEAVAKRHACAYLPFSYGPRACIGKHLALQMLKIQMANLLQHYSFESEGKFPDVRLKNDISVRPIDGYNVKVTRRTWN